jgi:hypothetical protein
MKEASAHWDAIFTGADDSTLGWYENDLTKTLCLLDQIKQWQQATIFVSGAGTSTLIDELLTKETTLVLNDISSVALENVKSRIGDSKNTIHWLHQDIAQPIDKPIPAIDIWIDRAVLHFLTEEKMIKGYFNNLKEHLSIGGYAIFAEFSHVGAKQCAGLTVHQYSIETLSARLGASFQLISHFDHLYINPRGDEKPYIYALFMKTEEVIRETGQQMNCELSEL